MHLLLGTRSIRLVAVAVVALLQGGWGLAAAEPALPASTPVDGGASVFADFESRAGESGIRTVQLLVDGVDVSAAASVTAARVAWVPLEPLTAGEHRATALVTDALGRVHEKSWTFTVAEELRPEVALFFDPALSVSLDVLPRRTLATSVRVSGTTRPGAEVELRVNGRELARVVARESGQFEAMLGLEAGDNELRVTARDLAGTGEGVDVVRRVLRAVRAVETGGPGAADPGPAEDPSVPPRESVAADRGGPGAARAEPPGAPPATLVDVGGPGFTPLDPLDGDPDASVERGTGAVPAASRQPREAHAPTGPVSVPQLEADDGAGNASAARGAAPGGLPAVGRPPREAHAPSSPASTASSSQSFRGARAPGAAFTLEAASTPSAAELRAPSLTLTQPARRALSVRESTLRVEGLAWPGAEIAVDVNGRLAATEVAGLGGRFVVVVPLEAGSNMVQVEAADRLADRTARSPLLSVTRTAAVRLPEPPLGVPEVVRPARPIAPRRR